jgi:hypothetical protein
MEDQLRHRIRKATISAIIACALSVAIGVGNVGTALADEAEAKSLFKAMSDYLAAQTSLSFDYDSDLEFVTKDQQKLGLASSGSVTLKRPNQLRAARHGGFADVELVFDGTTLTVLGKHANAYAQVEAPGTVDQLIDTLRDKYQRPIPGADLLSSNVYDQVMPLVVDVKDLGSGVIGGVECNHLAFRTSEVDWQIWIAAGDQPYPCRYVITSNQVTGSPEYRLDVRNWKAGGDVASADFAFKAPPDAKKLELGKLTDIDELPDVFAMGAAK